MRVGYARIFTAANNVERDGGTIAFRHANGFLYSRMSRLELLKHPVDID